MPDPHGGPQIIFVEFKKKKATSIVGCYVSGPDFLFDPLNNPVMSVLGS